MGKIDGLQRLDDKIATETDANTKKGLIGEKQILLMLEKQLPTNAHIIHDPALLHFEADILVIEEKLGFIFIEVKTWSEQFVEHFHPNGKVSVKAGEHYPLKQAENYREELKHILDSMVENKKGVHKLITSVVVFNTFAIGTFLNRPEVKLWSADMKDIYFKMHYFYSEQPVDFYKWLLKSRKFPEVKVSYCFSEEKLCQIIKTLAHSEHTENAQKEAGNNIANRFAYMERQKVLDEPGISSLDKEGFRSKPTEQQTLGNVNKKIWSAAGLLIASVIIAFLIVTRGNHGSVEYSYEDDYADTEVIIDDSQDTAKNESNNLPADAPIQNAYNYYILADSQYDKLTESQLYGLTQSDLRLARNEIYARHGYIFKSLDLDYYFNSQAWYTMNQNYDGELTDVELYNVEVIQSLE